MGRINDISFDIGGKLVVLLEHQSTINPNMAVRLLMYIVRVYEKVLRGKSLTSGKRLTIPNPEFFVLYNGIAPYPDEEILWLSDAFERPVALGLEEKAAPSLELLVRVININEGRNTELVDKCRKLAEYSTLIAKIRTYERELGDKEAAMKAAIKFCLDNAILREFLEQHSTEVFNMLITEWDTEKAKEVWYEEGMEQGLEKGQEQEREGIVKHALLKGTSPEQIHDITGVDMETIQNIQARQ